ncbi:hypothetical protein PR202_ga09824 [Eleusine coracana subsp. coracana]|uniref:Phosphoribosyltransferase domain-containing protein n=1 Tax=Eleusine coracana subsp. coracana TaxID=191504 RepID=A0AAV5C5J9_ELECO|nr:hypothetical protein PR202_ga09824 [Eleusine coracana subsp. coracana]
MATAASASPAGTPGAKTAARAPRPSPTAFPRQPSSSSRGAPASAPGRLCASLHLGGATAIGNGSGIHVPPVIAPLALPKMASSRGTQKSILLFYCEEMRDLAEQVVARNDDIELRSVSWRILSNIPISRGGPSSLVIFDIHALQERFYFGDSVLPCFESGIPLLKSRLQELPDSQNITIAFPDDGAWKRFYKQLQHFPMVICNKVREGEQRIVRIKEGDPKGRHVVIVDDLVQSGGTLIECQKVLAAHGAAKVSAYATHGIFPNKSWEKFQPDNGEGPEHGLSHFWITDSCPLTVKAVQDRRPFEILSLAGSIASALQI